MSQIQQIQQFLRALSTHNSIQWMHEHEKEKKEAQAAFYELIAYIQTMIFVFDPYIAITDAKNISFKLNRDTRFGKDSSPYHCMMRAHISSAGKLPIPVGYFIVVTTDSIMVGGGLFADQFKDATLLLRQYVSEHGDKLNQIVKDPTFSRYFSIRGTKLKRVPKPYEETYPFAAYLCYKNMYIEYDIQEESDEAYHREIITCCKAMKPFNDYMNQALQKFVMPQRS